MPIRIAIDARPFAGPPCGYTIYLASIIHCLRHGDFDITLLGNRPPDARYESEIGDLKTRIFGSTSMLRWENGALPRQLAAGAYDLYFSGANRGMPLWKRRGTRYILGLLDAIPYLYFREYYLSRWKNLLRHPRANEELVAQLISVFRADAILTISRQSAADITRIFHRKSVTPILIRLRDIRRYAAVPPRAQFVYVGGADFRKRLDTLVRGFALFHRDHPGHRLLLVGWNYGAVAPLIAEAGLGDRVVLTGYVDEDTKFGLLRESLAMVYPSLYEGYGMAIAEGFQAGIPVVAGGGGSQGEVGGPGTRRIDPLSPADIAAAMAEMLDTETRAAWVARGQEQLARLTDPGIEQATIAYFRAQGELARHERDRR